MPLRIEAEKYRFCHNDPARMAHFGRPRCPTTRPWRPWRQRVADIRAGRARELVWLLEHPPLYTAGHQRQGRTTCCSRCAFPSMSRAAAGNTPITGPASAWSTPCSTCAGAARTCGASSPTSRNGPSAPSPASTCAAERRAGRVGVWVARERRPRGQDRRDRRAHPPLGVVPRPVDQRRARPVALCRHRALRHRRARRDLAGRSRPAGDHGRSRHRAGARRSTRCSARRVRPSAAA